MTCMGNGKKTSAVIAIIALTAIIVGVILSAATRENPSSSASPSVSTVAPSQAKSTPQQPSLTEEERQARANMAVQVEHAMRDWGADANQPAATYAYKNVDEALNQLHATPISGNPLKSLTSLDIKDTWGPDTSSVPCTLDMNGACTQSPSMGQWWAHEAWSYGSRWSGEPQARVLDDGTVEVTGDVRAILLQDGDSYHYGDWYAITPAWRTYPVKDTLTFDADGRVTSIQHHKSDYWWINPYLNEWDEDMPANLGDGHRQVIPVKGRPRMGLAHLPAGRWLRGVENMGEMDNVDWTLWDAGKMGICIASCAS